MFPQRSAARLLCGGAINANTRSAPEQIKRLFLRPLLGLQRRLPPPPFDLFLESNVMIVAAFEIWKHARRHSFGEVPRVALYSEESSPRYKRTVYTIYIQ